MTSFRSFLIVLLPPSFVLVLLHRYHASPLTSYYLSVSPSSLLKKGREGKKLYNTIDRIVSTGAVGDNRALVRSDEFQIQSKTQVDLCIQAQESESDESSYFIVVQTCSTSSVEQKWSVDQYGRFHSKPNPSLCIKKDGTVSKCNMNFNRNIFSFNAFDDTICSRNGNFALGWTSGSRVSFSRSSSNQGWNLVPSLFLSKDDLPLEQFLIKSKADSSLCIEASSLQRGAPFLLEPCDTDKITQLWKADDSGVIRIASRETKCTMVKGGSLEIASPCRRIRNKHMFMYDSISSKIVHKRNGRSAFTIADDNTIEISNKDPSKDAIQQWLLEAP